MTDQERITQEIRTQITQEMITRFQKEKEQKLNCYRQQNRYIRKGETLFTGSSLMEQFPITEFCLSKGLPIAYNRGIGGYTTDEFLAGIDVMLLDPRPKKLFINIGTNDIREMPDGEDWFTHLSENYRKICAIIRDRLPETTVYPCRHHSDPGVPDSPDVSGWRAGFSLFAHKAVLSVLGDPSEKIVIVVCFLIPETQFLHPFFLPALNGFYCLLIFFF